MMVCATLLQTYIEQNEVMKRFLILLIAAFWMTGASQAQPNAVWINTGSINAPNPDPIPAIDATNFVNQGTINISGSFTLIPFGFADVLNYTNRGTMSSDVGFTFNDISPSSGFSGRSAFFGNANVGKIYATGGYFTYAYNSGKTLDLLAAQYGDITISATNVVNNGLLQCGSGGLLTIDGYNVDLSRGSAVIDPSEVFDAVLVSSNFITSGNVKGISPAYWGLGSQTNVMKNGVFTTSAFQSPRYSITNVVNSFFLFNNYQIFGNHVTASGNVQLYSTGNSNSFYQYILVGNAHTNDLKVTTYYGASDPMTPAGVPMFVQLAGSYTNATGTVQTNYIYISDTFGSDTNLALKVYGYDAARDIEYIPTNYYIDRLTNDITKNFIGIAPGNTPFDLTALAGTVLKGATNNDFAAFGFEMTAETTPPDPAVPGQTFTNIPGRMEINADNYLNLYKSTVTGPNFLGITATNHCTGTDSASVSSPNISLNLGTTNGFLSISNFIPSKIAALVGSVEIYSSRWTNVDTNGVTNSYSILLVNADLSASQKPAIQTLFLRSTNVSISDSLEIATNNGNNFLIDSQNFTLTANPVNPAFHGELIFDSTTPIWQNAFPNLNNFTNSGDIISPTTIYMAKLLTDPYSQASITNGYSNIANFGTINCAGLTTLSSNFVANNSNSTNAIIAQSGPINISANNVTFMNANISNATSGDIFINAGNLALLNGSKLTTPGSLFLSVTNSISDSGATSSNVFQVYNGIYLENVPAFGGLYGTTISNYSYPGFDTVNLWSAPDLGRVASGYANNGALGHLVLNALDSSAQFAFQGPDSTNKYAIYVDKLELQGGMTNFSGSGTNLSHPGFDIDPNFTIYYANAMSGSNDVSETLNHAYGYNGSSGGSLVWLPAYAGIFSGTNFVYKGVTNFVNKSLLYSKSIDSNGNGKNNFSDLTNGVNPFYSQTNISMKVTRAIVLSTNTVTHAVSTNIYPSISWNLLGNNATNSVIYTTNLNIPTATWSVLTNFQSATNINNFNFVDKTHTNGLYYYRLNIYPYQP